MVKEIKNPGKKITFKKAYPTFNLLEIFAQQKKHILHVNL